VYKRQFYQIANLIESNRIIFSPNRNALLKILKKYLIGGAAGTVDIPVR